MIAALLTSPDPDEMDSLGGEARLRRARTRRTPDRATYTGAVVRGQTLFIATIGDDADGRRRLIASRSGELGLVGRDQGATRQFASTLEAFLEARSIDQIMVCYSPSKGPHMATAECYKIEAVLQVAPITVDIVAAIALTCFEKREKLRIPPPDARRLTRAFAACQERAILAAAYAEHAAVNAMPARKQMQWSAGG